MSARRGSRGRQGGPIEGLDATALPANDNGASRRLVAAGILASGVARIVLGIDQARTSGWAIAAERGPVLVHGIAKTHHERRMAVLLAVQHAGGDPRRVFAMLEDHSKMPIGKGTRHDPNRSRAAQFAAPTRSLKTLIGIGKAYGRWEAVLDEYGVPESMRDDVAPMVWRARLGIRGATDELRKQAAVDWVKRDLGVVLTSDDEAEACCIARFAALDGLARHDAKKTLARAKAYGKKQAASQGRLFDVE